MFKTDKVVFSSGRWHNFLGSFGLGQFPPPPPIFCFFTPFALLATSQSPGQMRDVLPGGTTNILRYVELLVLLTLHR